MQKFSSGFNARKNSISGQLIHLALAYVFDLIS